MSTTKKIGALVVVPQFTSYTFDTAPPKRVGDEALIITAWHEHVHVILIGDDDGALWLVAVNRRTAPIVLKQAPPRHTRKGRTLQVRQNRQARLVAQVLELKRTLRRKMAQVRREAP